MARILISTMPETGHVNPATPVARELVQRGHRVTWHTGSAFRATVEATGASFEPFVEAPDFQRLPAEPDPGTTGLAEGVSIVRRLFIDRVPGQVADYARITAGFRPDVIVADMCSFGAATFHDLGGPPFATLGINPLVTLDPEIPPWGSGRPASGARIDHVRNRVSHWLAKRLFGSKVTAALNAERAKVGLPDLPQGVQFTDLQQSPYLHVMPTTLAFEYPRQKLGRQIHFVGPLLPPAASFEPPSWWTELDGCQVVHVTQGTFATDAADLIRPTIEGLADSGLLVVVTTRDGEAPSAIPANVRFARYIPHRELLPRVAAMVTNAGYNGVLAALANGVPLVAAGQTEDKAEVSVRVAWSGAGIDLRTGTPSPGAVRAAVERVLEEPAYRRNARRIQADFARHDGPREAADLLEQLASTGQPVVSTNRSAA